MPILVKYYIYVGNFYDEMHCYRNICNVLEIYEMKRHISEILD